MRFSSREIADVVGGKLFGPDVICQGVNQNSRELIPGQLFIPLRADRDGHEFISDACSRGASAYLTEIEPSLQQGDTSTGITFIVVSDTQKALCDLAIWGRSRFTGEVIGITGSVGKTSTKDLVTSVLSTTFRVSSSEKSFNNEIGVPLTILNTPDDAEVIVVEMGARGKGHIALLCEIAKPTIGIVTTVDAVHTGVFHSVEEIAQTKAELVESIVHAPNPGTVILNNENSYVSNMQTIVDEQQKINIDGGKFPQNILVGTGGSIYASSITTDADLFSSFEVHTPIGDKQITLGVRGEHQVTNALCAIAVGLCLRIPLDKIAEGLQHSTLSPWRMELTRIPSGPVIINDAYNANPTSMRAALEAFSKISANRHIAILGEMAELGAEHDVAHQNISDLAKERKISVVAVDTPSYNQPKGQSNDARDANVFFERVETKEEAFKFLQSLSLDESDAVLFKGSRIAGLETLANEIIDTYKTS